MRLDRSFELRLRIALAIALTSVAVLALAAEARALGITTSSISFPPTTLDGTNQVLAGTTSAWRADATGETAGWNVTVSASDFDNGAGKLIARGNLEIRLLDSNTVRVSGDASGPVSTQTSFVSFSSNPVKIASSAAGVGNGVYDLTPDFRLSVPAQTYTGNYTSTITVSISSGP